MGLLCHFWRPVDCDMIPPSIHMHEQHGSCVPSRRATDCEMAYPGRGSAPVGYHLHAYAACCSSLAYLVTLPQRRRPGTAWRSSRQLDTAMPWRKSVGAGFHAYHFLPERTLLGSGYGRSSFFLSFCSALIRATMSDEPRARLRAEVER